ncbi:MAG: hypothetical protein V8T01_04335 [Oscillospiraceae bacterium]
MKKRKKDAPVERVETPSFTDPQGAGRACRSTRLRSRCRTRMIYDPRGPLL